MNKLLEGKGVSKKVWTSSEKHKIIVPLLMANFYFCFAFGNIFCKSPFVMLIALGHCRHPWLSLMLLKKKAFGNKIEVHSTEIQVFNMHI